MIGRAWDRTVRGIGTEDTRRDGGCKSAVRYRPPARAFKLAYNMDVNQLTESSPLERMIQQQIVDRGIKDERVLAAIRGIPRARFFPDQARDDAYADRPAPIGHGQTISTPH